MEVFLTNVPQNTTNKLLRRNLDKLMQELSIVSVFRCEKLRGMCAKLTFADTAAAEKLLEEMCGQRNINSIPRTIGGQYDANHQQPRKPLSQQNSNIRHGQKGVHNTQPRMTILGKTVNFQKSKYKPDDFLVRSLRDEAQKSGAAQAPSHAPSPPLKKGFDIVQLEVGSWDYSKKGSCVFVSYYSQLCSPGMIHFGRHHLGVRMTMSPNVKHEIEVEYIGIDSIHLDATFHTVTMTLEIAPKMYESDPTEQVIAMRMGAGRAAKKSRIHSLGPHWNGVGATCFVYKTQLRDPADLQRIAMLKNNMQIPDMSFWGAPSVHPGIPYDIVMAKFDSLLRQDDSLPFGVKFQIQKLVYNGSLPCATVVGLLGPTRRLLRHAGSGATIQVLQRLSRDMPWSGPEAQSSDFSIENIIKNHFDVDELVLDSFENDEYTSQRSLVHKVMITPQGLYLFGPQPEIKNRVLRRYRKHTDHFLRVELADESGDPLRYDPRATMDRIYNERFKSVLRDGFEVGGRKFSFLGFSHSSLRSQSCWFIAPFIHENDGLVNYKTIIPLLGDFTGIYSPARYAARIGQTFSDTLTSIAVPKEQVSWVADVTRNGRTFSDGVGTVSRSLMKKILKEYASRAPLKPTVFQIRFAGAKGMISLDTRLHGDQLVLRQSMNKFPVEEPWYLEICGSGVRPLPMFLNKPLIKILEDLGVGSEPFLELLRDEVERMRLNAKSPRLTADFLDSSNVAKATKLSALLRQLGDLNITYSDDDFLRNAIELAVIVKLRELKYRARIRVPDGVTLYGIMDETGTLDEGEVFVCIHGENGGRQVLEGEGIVITRSPALHPGDVQFAKAVDVPDSSPLQQLHNCIVFSQKGRRDLPSQLSGGDLDGDLYNVLWDLQLSPKRIYQPADYPSVKPRALDRPVERNDVIDHFLTFMQQDQLGRIANVHLTIADQSWEGTLDPRCITLAQLGAEAVDFSKTGIPADVSKIPKYPQYKPDFMAPGPRVKVYDNLAMLQDNTDMVADDDDDEGERVQRYYKSDKVLGQLYREIDEHSFLNELEQSIRPSGPSKKNVLAMVWDFIQYNTMSFAWDHHVNEMRDIQESYEENLLEIMHGYSVAARKSTLTEIEVFIGNIIGKNDGQTKRARERSMAMREQYENLVSQITGQILNFANGGREALERSVACFSVSIGSETKKKVRRVPKMQKELQSFKWIAAAICLQEVSQMQRLPKSLKSLLASSIRA